MGHRISEDSREGGKELVCTTLRHGQAATWSVEWVSCGCVAFAAHISESTVGRKNPIIPLVEWLSCGWHLQLSPLKKNSGVLKSPKVVLSNSEVGSYLSCRWSGCLVGAWHLQLTPLSQQWGVKTPEIVASQVRCTISHLVGRMGEGEGLGGGERLVGLAVVGLDGDPRDELRQSRPARVRARQRLQTCADVQPFLLALHSNTGLPLVDFQLAHSCIEVCLNSTKKSTSNSQS